MKYRSRADIVADMLEVAIDGAIKTRIMYRSFLSFPQLNEYLEILMENGLLEFNEEERKYFTTEKGKHYLKMYNAIGRLIAPTERRTRVKR